MQTLPLSFDESPSTALRSQHFVFVDGIQTRELLTNIGSLYDWQDFAASWDDLIVDNYLAEQGRFRRRRYAAYAISDHGEVVRHTHQAHFQHLAYNSLQGGIERWFEPMSEQAARSESFAAVLRFAHATFQALSPGVPTWKVEVHQFRIEARPDEPGQPTPEGKHRDGVDYVLVLLIKRQNIASGTTTIHTPDGELLGEFTLTAPFDTALVVDEKVHHGVTPVHAADPAKPAYRDVLVVTFRAN
jgi:hypothetical protein